MNEELLLCEVVSCLLACSFARRCHYSLFNHRPPLNRTITNQTSSSTLDMHSAQWLIALNLPQYTQALTANGFEDDATFRTLTETDLVQCGVDNLGHRRTSIQTLGQPQPGGSSTSSTSTTCLPVRAPAGPTCAVTSPSLSSSSVWS